MRNRILQSLGAALVGCCLLAGSPKTAAPNPPAKKKNKKKTKRPAAPPVSPAARAAGTNAVRIAAKLRVV